MNTEFILVLNFFFPDSWGTITEQLKEKKELHTRIASEDVSIFSVVK